MSEYPRMLYLGPGFKVVVHSAEEEARYRTPPVEVPAPVAEVAAVEAEPDVPEPAEPEAIEPEAPVVTPKVTKAAKVPKAKAVKGTRKK